MHPLGGFGADAGAGNRIDRGDVGGVDGGACCRIPGGHHQLSVTAVEFGIDPADRVGAGGGRDGMEGDGVGVGACGAEDGEDGEEWEV